MRRSRAVIVAGGSAAILGAGWWASPKSFDTGPSEPEPEVDLVGADVFTGPPVSNLKGTYQAQIYVRDGEVLEVDFPTAGTQAAESVGVNARALPELRARVLAAQDWDVEHVSGASYTSPAMVESLQGAFEQAGLGSPSA